MKYIFIALLQFNFCVHAFTQSQATILPDSLYLDFGDPYPIGTLNIRNSRTNAIARQRPGLYAQASKQYLGLHQINLIVSSTGLISGEATITGDEFKGFYKFQNSRLIVYEKTTFKDGKIQQFSSVIIDSIKVNEVTKDSLGNLIKTSSYFINNPTEKIDTLYYKGNKIKEIINEIGKTKTTFELDGQIATMQETVKGEKLTKEFKNGKLKYLRKQRQYPSKYDERYDDNELLEYREIYDANSEKQPHIEEYYQKGKLLKKTITYFLEETSSERTFKQQIFNSNNVLIETKTLRERFIFAK